MCHTLPPEPSDYSGQQMNLVFNAGNDDMMLCIMIPIQDDQLCEGSETINVLLSSSDENALINSPSQGTVTILDDDGMYAFVACFCNLFCYYKY